MRKLVSVTITGAMMLTLVIGLYGGVVEEGEGGATYDGGTNTIIVTGSGNNLGSIYAAISDSNIFWYNESTSANYSTKANILVMDGATLSFIGGDVLKFDKNNSNDLNLEVRGKINCIGVSSTNKVLLTSNESSPVAGDWEGIRFVTSEAENSTINYISISYPQDGIYFDISSPIISNSFINMCLGSGVLCVGASPNIKTTNISNNGNGSRLISSSPVFENSTFINNLKDIYLFSDSHPVVLNSSFDFGKIFFDDAVSDITIKWYLHTYIEDNATHVPVQYAEVWIRDYYDNDVEGSPFITNGEGLYEWIKVVEYVRSNTPPPIYYTPHNITVIHEEYYTGYAYPEPYIGSSKKVQVNLTMMRRDLTTDTENITFSTADIPIAGEDLTIYAKIHNIEIDDAQDVRVVITDHAPEGDLEIHNSTISEIKGNSYKNAVDVWKPTPGTHTIEVNIDPFKEISEINSDPGVNAEDNNNENVTIDVNARPIINVTDPDEGIELNGTTHINGTAFDDTADDSMAFNDIEHVDITLKDYDWVRLDRFVNLFPNGTPGGWYWFYEWDTTQWNGTPLPDGPYTIQARAWDNYHYSHLYEVNITINNTGANEAPVAVINEPLNNSHFSVNQSIKFNGSQSYDPNNDTLTYEWNFDDGNFAPGNITYHSFNQKGTFNVKLTVNDSQVQNFTYVTVIIDNYPPYVELTASATSVYVNQTITFYGYNSSDAETPVLTFLWDYDNTTDANGDGNYTNDIDNMTITPIENTTHSYDQPGTYIVTLNVWDGRINSTDTVVVTILPNVAPTAVINDPDPLDTFSVNETIFFNASGSSDPNDEDLEYLWDFGDGTIRGWITEPNTTYFYSELGNLPPVYNYTVILRVRDDEGLVDSTFITIFVNNIPPVAIARSNLTTAQTNQDINFDGTDSYDQPPGSTTLSFFWDFGDGNTSAVANTTHQFAQDGEYNVTLTVSDGMGANDTDWIIITITNREPIIENVSISPQSPKMNEEITFTVTAIDDDGEVVKYSWNFGDGTTYSENKTNAPDNIFDGITKHTYSAKNTYNVIVTIEDDDGAMDTYQFEVMVVNSPPEVIISYPTDGSTVSDIITISGTASDPDDGDTISEVYIKIDDGEWLSASGTTTWSYEWDTKMVFNGQRIIYARSYDGEDYSSESSRTVTVSNTPSSIIVSINLNPGTIEAGGTVEVYGDVIYNTGEEVPDATINVTIIGEEGYWATTTDSMGEYSVEIMAPGEASTYTIRVIAEEETYSYQDTETSLLTVTAPPAMPDLEVTTADISFNPSAPDSGMNVQITITVRNIGDANANNFDVNAYLDQAGGTPIDTDTISVQKNDEKNVIFNWATTGISGSHYIYVVLDPGDDIAESNENNNEASRPITITGKPDYAVESSDISFSKPDPKEGETINILVVIHNEGTEGGIVTYEVYDGDPGDDNLIGDGQKSVSGNDEETVIVEWKIEGSGEHEIYVVLDPDDDVDEDDEDNNEASETITVEPGPDEGGIPGILIPLIVILAIVVIIILLFIYRREQGPKPSKEMPLAQVVEKEVKTKTVKVEKDEEEEKSLLDGQGGVRI